MKLFPLIIALLAASLLWAEKPDPKAVVGKIDEKTYTYSEYNGILTNYLAYYQKQQATPFTDEDKSKYNDRCWEELVGRYIYDKAIKAGKVTITTQELLREAKKNPPAAVKQIKDLIVNGKFDQKSYEKALNEAPEFRDAVLDEVRSLYQYNKLLEAIRSEVDADEDSVRLAWIHDHEVLDAQIIFFDANKMTSITASDEDALMYYNGRKEEYRKDNVRRLHFVRFAKAATPADSLAAHERAMHLYQELVAAPDSFAVRAIALSEDKGSGQNGGDLGWFGRGRMVKPFEDVAFSTPNGQIAEPVLSQFGWHIIQTLDRRTTDAGEEVSARHILLRVAPSEATLQNMKASAAVLHSAAKKSGLVAAADSMGFILEESPVFQQNDSFIRNIGRDANLVAFAFANPVGSVADIYTAPSGDMYVCAVSAELPVYYTPFEDEKANIQQAATRSKRGFYMNQYVQNFINTLTPDQYLSTATKDSVVIISLKDHKKGDPITSLGKVDTLDQLLFDTPEGSFTPLVSEQMRWFIAQVDRHAQPDFIVWEQEKAGLLQKAREDLRQAHLNDWYRAERQKVSIIDNRRDFYNLSSGKMQLLRP